MAYIYSAPRFPTRRFSAVHNVGPKGPATLGKALIRQYLVYPLASFDISGQQPVFVQTPHANEEYLLLYHEQLFVKFYSFYRGKVYCDCGTIRLAD